MLTYVSIVSVVLGLILIILDLFTGDIKMLVAAIATFVAGSLCAYLAAIRKNREAAGVVPTVFCAVMFTLYTFTGLGQGTGIFWSLLMPIGICYFVGIRNGIVLMTYYSLLYAAVFYTPLREYVSAHYSEAFMMRFPLVFISLSAFTLIAMVQYHRMALRDIAYTERLNAEVEKQTAVAMQRARQLELTSIEIVNMLAVAIDAKDRYTNGHSFRVAAYAVALAQRLGLPGDEIQLLQREAMLHDIGKIGIPDDVLNKPGRLTPDEFRVIQSHTSIGWQILEHLSSLQGAAEVARYHHERYAGKGYPTGASGDAIPLHARIVTIADAYDAMRSNRIYRTGLSRERIRKELTDGRGTQFDPKLLDLFLELADSGVLDEVTIAANKRLQQAVEIGLFEKATDLLTADPAAMSESSEKLA